MDFKAIIELWPSTDMLAQDVYEKPDTVRKWEERNSIPADVWMCLLEAAKKRGYKITSDQLTRAAHNKKQKAA